MSLGTLARAVTAPLVFLKEVALGLTLPIFTGLGIILKAREIWQIEKEDDPGFSIPYMLFVWVVAVVTPLGRIWSAPAVAWRWAREGV